MWLGENYPPIPHFPGLVLRNNFRGRKIENKCQYIYRLLWKTKVVFTSPGVLSVGSDP